MLRALHRIVDAEPWVIDDAVSLALFGDDVRAVLDADPRRRQDAGSAALRGHVLVRSAFAEGRMREAVARGVRQYVALGAGFDTFAVRQPEWMSGTRLFEVDAPETQADKRRRLAAAGIAVPGNVVFAPVDFETSSLDDGLGAAGFDAAAPAFFSVLGVLAYLSRDAVSAIFRYVAARPAGSEIAFTFSQPGGDDALAQRVAELGEPLRWQIEPRKLDAMLRSCGFRATTFVDVAESYRMIGERKDMLRLPRRASLAAAIV
jgi:methyltransferase (TIGR00027 family)